MLTILYTGHTTRSGAVFNPWLISERVSVAIDTQALFEMAVNRADRLCDSGEDEEDGVSSDAHCDNMTVAAREHGVGHREPAEGDRDDVEHKSSRSVNRVAVVEGCEVMGLGAQNNKISEVVVERVANSTAKTKLKSKKEIRAEDHKHAKCASKRKQMQDKAGTSMKLVALRRAAQSIAHRANIYSIENAPHTSTGYIGKWGNMKSTPAGGSHTASESATMLQRLSQRSR